MKLDVTAMEHSKLAIRAIKMPRKVLSFFRKLGTKGPFTLLIDLEELPPETRYLQVTADFNVKKVEKWKKDHDTGEVEDIGYEELTIGQRSNPNNLVPLSLIAADPGAYNAKRIQYVWEQEDRIAAEKADEEQETQE